MLSFMPDVPIVDNEQTFKNALKEKSFDQLFTDSFAGEFGHCTREGNRILAENIAKSVYPLIQR